MKKLIVAALLLILANATIAQTGSIKGMVTDSLTGAALETATVTLFKKDSSIINYKLTDVYGSFIIDKLPLNTDILLNVTYVGFKSLHQAIRLDTAITTFNVPLVPALHDSLNVTVTAQIPIRMNGDTLEINPAAFKMNPNAVVEDLLTQVPGVVVWSDGTITMNGKKVPNVLVDGQPFLGQNDAKIATQNLPKDAIDKIQVYQEVDRTLKPEERRKTDSLLTMNIKLKENKQHGYFGKAGVGYGTSDRFESDLSFQMYNKRTSFGIGGGYNNINKNINNIREMFQNNTYRNYNPNLNYVGRFGVEGINKYHSIGGVFTHNFIENTNSRQNDRITLNYTKSGNTGYLTNQTLQDRTTGLGKEFIESNSVTNNGNDNHNMGVNYVKTNSYNDNFNFNGSAGFNNSHNNNQQTSDVRDSLNNPRSFNAIQTQSQNKSSNQSISTNYSRYNGTNPLKQFSINLNINNNQTASDRYVRSNFKSYLIGARDTSYNRYYEADNKSFNTNGSIDYSGLKRLLFGRFNLFGLGLAFNQRFSYNRTQNNAHTFDYDTLSSQYVVNTKLTNTNNNLKTEYAPSLALTKSFFKWKNTHYYNLYLAGSIRKELKQDNNQSSIDARNLNRSFSFLTYNGNAYYSYDRREKYRYDINASYNKSFDYPGIDQLYTITDDVDAFNIRTGNPDLKNRVNHNYGLGGGFNSQNPKSKFSLNGNLSANLTKSLNGVTDSIINDPSGKRYYYYVNARQMQTYSLNGSFNVSRRLKKSNIQLQYSANYNQRNTPNYIDRQLTETKTTNLSNNINLQLTLRSVVVFNIGKTYSNYWSDQSGSGLSSFKNYADISKLGLTLNLPKNFQVSATLDHTKNTGLEKPMMLWNAFASCRFLKSEQGELKFSAMDILKQFQNISNTADNFGTSTRITNGLQQYFLLTFSYYPRKFGKTAIKKRVVEQVW